ncbi:MAG: trypsin-like peptidase domain-containing protein [Deltaproteobacteria bacterium]|nr:trypsin-like peptidase domain-containing protein [Deltaproteobacteria bacterium]
MIIRHRNIKTIFAFIFSLAIIITTSGCVYIDVDTGSGNELPLFHEEASDLSGVPAEDLVIETENTLPDVVFRTSLIREVAEKSRKAVVSVYAQTKAPYRIHLLPIPVIGTGTLVRVPGTGLGSGFFIHPSGYILTNNHVIKRAQEVKVLTHDGADHKVIIVARDPIYDLALLKVVGGADHEFPVLPMGDSKQVDSGDMVIAVGNPIGLGHTVTSGIISHTGRNLSGTPEQKGRQIRFIQTDAAINPGSSGGPLITLSGAWIGINSAGAVSSEGIGFAAPSYQVKEFLDMIRTGEWPKQKQNDTPK